jgi:UDP-glucose 4-epimerase
MAGETILVTGGAGYIGGHVALALLERGYRVIVLDNLTTGFVEGVAQGAALLRGDVSDPAHTGHILRNQRVAAVMHFAGSLIVPESVEKPLLYYRNNTCASRALIEACVESGVRRFVFSSSAAVYGVPETIPISEDAPTLPINPYGSSKLMVERILADVAASTEFSYVSLRYFNVAGADPKLRLGQRSKQATHLIKVACEAAVGLRDGLTIFGTDFDTPDGTGLRDYIHVVDLAEAHVLALQRLLGGSGSEVFNCGYGHGLTVRQIITAVERGAGRPLRVSTGPRRPGDPPSLVANPRRLRLGLGWVPRYDNLEEIVGSALAWERKLNNRS